MMTLRLALLAAVILAALVIVNQIAARLAEWQNPPSGSFIEVEGVRPQVTEVAGDPSC